MTHSIKLTLARRMMTSMEQKKHIPPFQSAWWGAQKEATLKRLERQKKNNAKRKLKSK